ncbi:MAG: TIR domain-containing protein [Flavobacteriaceae bacterium]|nr:MAG: TIR domain-containing protein [Flavobacteriaceae bacterium]
MCLMTSNEQIVRNEAKDFYSGVLMNSDNGLPIDDFKEIKHRLHDFYTAESKAIFLDEIQVLMLKDLQVHRDRSHEGKADPNCQLEKDAETLIYYIKQEIDTFPKIAHQKFNTSSGNVRNKVFVSYSHLDKEYLKDIQRHFRPFLSQIDFWDDTKIEAGQKWKKEIRKAIDKTKVAILLVSTDFLGSEFIAENELPPLLEAAEKDGAVILIVILKPCLFEEFPKLNQYQAMNPPSKTVLSMDYREKEELYVNLVRQTKKILNKGD